MKRIKGGEGLAETEQKKEKSPPCKANSFRSSGSCPSSWLSLRCSFIPHVSYFSSTSKAEFPALTRIRSQQWVSCESVQQMNASSYFVCILKNNKLRLTHNPPLSFPFLSSPLLSFPFLPFLPFFPSSSFLLPPPPPFLFGFPGQDFSV